MEDISFTIHIPVYNTENYIKKCIDSVLSQSYTNFEVIITDDGSTDGSGALCDEYAARDSRVKVFHNQNHGVLLTRRFSIAKSTGDYSLFVDSDDYVEPNYLSSVYAALKKYECDVLIFNFNRVSSGKKKANLPCREQDTVFSTPNEKRELYKIFFETNRLNSIWSKAIKTSLLFNDSIDYKEYSWVDSGEDFLQSIEPLINAEKIVYITDALYNYVHNNLSIINSYNKNRVFSIMKSRECGVAYLESLFGADEKKAKRKAERAYASLDYMLVMNCVIEIALSSSSYTTKKTLYRSIKKNSYYGNFVRKHSSKRLLTNKAKIVSYLFDCGMYSPMGILKYYPM